MVVDTKIIFELELISALVKETNEKERKLCRTYNWNQYFSRYVEDMNKQ